MRKTDARIACEGEVQTLLDRARAEAWTLGRLRRRLRLRFAQLRQRKAVTSRSMWYRAILSVAGVGVTRLEDPRQLRLFGGR